MRSFDHTLRNDNPMPLISLGHLASIAVCYPDTTCTVEMGSRTADISHPVKLARMGLRKGDAVTVSVTGPSEVEMFDVLCQYFDAAM